MSSIINARPRQIVHVAASVYGVLQQPRHITQARLWVIVGPEAEDPQIRLGYNGPGGNPVWEDLGGLELLTVGRRGSWNAQMKDDSIVILVEAPCVCGAGAIGMAGPVSVRHEVVPVRQDLLPWLVRL